MDDRKMNPLRLIIGTGLVIYFAILLTSKPAEEPLVVQTPPPAPTAPTQAAAQPSANCQAQIEEVGLTSYELRLRLEGSAERIIIYTDQGNLTTSTTEAGSAGEYRVRTPAPATAVQIDDCPVLSLR